MIESSLTVGGNVTFPDYTGERVYMAPFFKTESLPASLSRWQSVVDRMVEGLDFTGPAYLMVDQGYVKYGKTQRRSGLHVDGNWVAGSGSHKHPAEEDPSGRHIHPPKEIPPGVHRHPETPKHRHAHGYYQPEALLLASNVAACRAMLGRFEGIPKEDGDCSHFDVSHGEEVLLEAGRVYRGNVTMLHESLPVQESCFRTLVRINIPGVH